MVKMFVRKVLRVCSVVGLHKCTFWFILQCIKSFCTIPLTLFKASAQKSPWQRGLDFAQRSISIGRTQLENLRSDTFTTTQKSPDRSGKGWWSMQEVEQNTEISLQHIVTGIGPYLKNLTSSSLSSSRMPPPRMLETTSTHPPPCGESSG